MLIHILFALLVVAQTRVNFCADDDDALCDVRIVDSLRSRYQVTTSVQCRYGYLKQFKDIKNMTDELGIDNICLVVDNVHSMFHLTRLLKKDLDRYIVPLGAWENKDMLECVSLAIKYKASDEIKRQLIFLGPNKLCEQLKSYVLGTVAQQERIIEDGAVKEIFLQALALSTDAQIKKFWRNYFYEKMYENDPFEKLEKASQENIHLYNELKKHTSEAHIQITRQIKNLPALKEWEESFERKAFCAAVDDEKSLHKAYDYAEKLGRFHNFQHYEGGFTHRMDFIKEYFYSVVGTINETADVHQKVFNEKMPLEYLHMPLLRLIMVYDDCLYRGNWARHCCPTVFDFSDHPAHVTDVDWKAVAKYPAYYNYSEILWVFALNNETESVPWHILSGKKILEAEKDNEACHYRNITIHSNKVKVPFKEMYEKPFKLHRRGTLWGKNSKIFFKRSILPVLQVGGIFAGLVILTGILWSTFARRMETAQLRYTHEVGVIFKSVSPEIQSTVSTLVQPNQSLLPGISVALPNEALAVVKSHVHTVDVNSTLLPLRSALQTIADIKAVPKSWNSFSFVLHNMCGLLAAFSTCLVGFAIGEVFVGFLKEVRNEPTRYIFDGTRIYPYKRLSWQWLDDEYGCEITIEKPEQDQQG